MGRAKGARGGNTRVKRRATGRQSPQQGKKNQRRTTAPVTDATGHATSTVRNVQSPRVQAPDLPEPVDSPQRQERPPAPAREASHRPAVGDPAEHHDAGRISPPSGSRRQPRRTHLRLAQIDLWSVGMTSALLCLGLGICVVVAMSFMWVAIEVTSPGPEPWPSLRWALTVMAVIVVVEVVVGTALALLAAFFYNFAAQYTGGVQLTLEQGRAVKGALRLRALLRHDRLRSCLPGRLRARLCD